MIYVRITEGLGNQFYKYAFAYSLARSLNQKLSVDLAGYKYDSRSFELDKYNITAEVVCLAVPKKNTSIEKLAARVKRRFQIGLGYKLLLESPESYFQYKPIKCPQNRNIYIQGYWQNYRYFSEYEKEIKNQFTIKNISEEIRRICDDLESENSIALHIRWGDYKLQDRVNEVYYHEAIEYIRTLVKPDQIYIFCEENDIELVHTLFDKYHVKYIVEEFPGLTDIETFELMRSCRYQIISNSTYSWWAAWLNQYERKKIIAPLPDYLDCNYYPSEWILIRSKCEKGKG